jgi:sortase A
LGVAGNYAWLLWGTGLATARAQSELRTVLEERIQRRAATAPPATENGSAPVLPVPKVSIRPGDPVAILQIPRIGLDMVVVEGTGTEALKKGPGHYPDSALPWAESGRMAIAGHRTTYMHPFWSLDRLRKGDLIRLVTEYGTFEYRMSGIREVVPTASWILRDTAKPSLVLTTCTPRFWATHRLVVFASR